jgi:beta-N-acetylhexosaminidase
VARAQRVGLCLKHFPGIGGAAVDSHQEFMDISDGFVPEQEELFYSLAPKMFGDAVLVSHAIVRQWDKDRPMTLSAPGLGRLRQRLPETLLITDDMQMQGLQKALGTREASLQSLKAGMDMLCIGNNLFDQEHEMAAIAEYVERSLRDNVLSGSAIEKSIARVAKAKSALDGVTAGTRERSSENRRTIGCLARPLRLQAFFQWKDRRWPIISRSMTTFTTSSRARKAAPRRRNAASTPS